MAGDLAGVPMGLPISRQFADAVVGRYRRNPRGVLVTQARRGANMTPMTITYARPPKRKRPPKPPQPALAAAIVTTRKRGPKPVPDDPEADARVRAWFARNVRPLGT
jgi:hypothetical protein